MKVFKFGGASVKDAAGVRNLAEVVKRYGLDDLVIVVSAMGKTTNALEEVVWAWIDGRPTDDKVDALEQVHSEVLHEVAPHDEGAGKLLTNHFHALRAILKHPATKDIDLHYDQVVSFGELWSSVIVKAHLDASGITSAWWDARTVVRTDGRHRSASVDWEASADGAAILRAHVPDAPFRVVTQGFIGGAKDGTTTTLGREGSDFSAAIFAYLLDAESVTIWKDVAGTFNADPNRFADTTLLEHISYREAIELSYFGASVIHPRTLQPLQRKNIPLYVRSFLDAEVAGSTISDATDRDTLVPSFIVKPKQLLISITPRDLSFIVEENLSGIFKCFADRQVRIELMQNSALAFSVAVDDSPRARQLIEELRKDYEVRYNESCELITVRHYDEATLKRLLNGKEPLIEQRSRTTARFVVN
ncbi:MAG: aspartate kinase [Flavobacteriales bacterium]|nr:aspartate kinase [Flavobacteriales bacterium]